MLPAAHRSRVLLATEPTLPPTNSSNLPGPMGARSAPPLDREKIEYGSCTAALRRTPLGGSGQFGRDHSAQFGKQSQSGGPAQLSGPSQPRANTLWTISTPQPHYGGRSPQLLSPATATATMSPTTAYARHLPVDTTVQCPKHIHGSFRRFGHCYGATGKDHPQSVLHCSRRVARPTERVQEKATMWLGKDLEAQGV